MIDYDCINGTKDEFLQQKKEVHNKEQTVFIRV
jgi:hypothetical protein